MSVSASQSEIVLLFCGRNEKPMIDCDADSDTDMDVFRLVLGECRETPNMKKLYLCTIS
jgi:hypothetical protein